MDDYEYWRGGSRVPAFGSWDCNVNEGLPFTECFDRARQARLLRCNYFEDRDLYVPENDYDDLYQLNDMAVAPPPMFLVPRPRSRRTRRVKQRKIADEEWVVCDCDETVVQVKEPPSPLTPSPPRRPAKAVDEDLYKISPDLLHAKQPRRKKMRGFGFLASCFQPSCVH